MNWREPLSDSEPLRALIPDIDAALGLSGRVVSRGSICGVVKVAAGGRTYYVKRYHTGGKGIRRWLGAGRMDHELANLDLLAGIGVPTARVVAVGRETIGPRFVRGVLITEEVPDVMDLATMASAEPRQLANHAWVRESARQLASHLALMHGAGFVHRDLKWRNVLVGRSGAERVFLIDCPSGRRRRWWMLRRDVVRDLASLDKMARRFLTRTDRLRFFLAYRGRERVDDADKRLIRKVLGFRFRSERRRESQGKGAANDH